MDHKQLEQVRSPAPVCKACGSRLRYDIWFDGAEGRDVYVCPGCGGIWYVHGSNTIYSITSNGISINKKINNIEEL